MEEDVDSSSCTTPRDSIIKAESFSCSNEASPPLPPHVADEHDEDEWFSIGSFGSTSNRWEAEDETMAAGTAALGEQDVFPYSSSPPSATTTTTTLEEQQLFHGVVALKEAEQQRLKQSQNNNNNNNLIQQCCLPRVFAKPQPLWLDFSPSSSSSNSLNHHHSPALDDSTSSSPSFQQQQQPQELWLEDEDESEDETTSCKENKMTPGNRLGMLLWTTKNRKRSSATSSSSTSVTTTSSSMLSCGSYSSNNNNNNNNQSSWSVWNYEQLAYTAQELALSADEPTPASDLNQPRHVWIVTTASLPWMTGTAVNPLLRAGSLWNHYDDLAQTRTEKEPADFSVTLVLPWLCRAEDRVTLYGEGWEFKSVQDQEDYIRQWLKERANMPAASLQIAIQWYAAHYHPALSSIFAVDDVCDSCTNVPPNAVCVLEEPEHLNCYRAPGKASWRQRFSHVVGIVHTNYRAYAQAHASGLVTGPLVGALFATLVQAYCDKVIKLSDVLQSYAPEKEVTSNVHGIRQEFLSMGAPTGNKVYFIGKLLWAKGLDKLLTLQSHYKKATGNYFEMDIFGSGPEQEDISEAFFYGTRGVVGARRRRRNRRANRSDAATTASSSSGDESTDDESQVRPELEPRLPVSFRGRLDHASMSSQYKIFVNPSVTEVLCTTTAEALAMGKFVIIPHHSSNHFFSQFPNCLQYHSKYEFCVLLKYALTHTPTPLSEAQRHVLTWEAATERLFKASAISRRDEARRERLAGKQGDERLAQMHEDICKGNSGVVVRTIIHGKDPQTKGNSGKAVFNSSNFDREKEDATTIGTSEEDGGSMNGSTV